MKPSVRYIIENVNMGLEHSGLASLLGKEFDIDVFRLRDDECCLVVNTSKTAIKAVGSGGAVLGYLRMPQGEKLKISSIKYISEAFGGPGFQFTEAVRKKLAVLLGDKSGKLISAG